MVASSRQHITDWQTENLTQLFLCIYHPTLLATTLRFQAVLSDWRSGCPVHSSGQTLLPRSHEQLEQFCQKMTAYSLAPTDDMIRFWRSKVRVTAAEVCGGKSTHVDVRVDLLVSKFNHKYASWNLFHQISKLWGSGSHEKILLEVTLWFWKVLE